MKRLLEAFEHDQELTLAQRMVLVAIVKYMDKSGTCYPSYKALQRTTGATAATISSNLKKLVAAGWLTYERGNNLKQESNKYQLNFDKICTKEELIKPTIESPPKDNRFLAADGKYYDSPADYYTQNRAG